MNKAEEIAARLESVFTTIHNERMAGIPILNDNLKVEAIGFKVFEGRYLGVLITPWLMNLMLFPAKDEDWSQLNVGEARAHEFPAGIRNFLVNHFDGIGNCQTLALFSPMFGFKSQDQARAAARRSMDELMILTDPEDQLDEKRLERFLNGEDMSQIQQDENETDISLDEDRSPPQKIARSDFIRGNFARKRQV